MIGRMLHGIVACDPNGVIAVNGEIPWTLKEDVQMFKHLTAGNVVIMGRKTYESMNCEPLKNRYNIVLSHKKEGIVELISPWCIHCPDICSVIRKAQEIMELQRCGAWVIGGAEIYSLFLPYIESFYVTRVSEEYEGDVDIQETLDKMRDWKWNELFSFKNLATVYRVVRNNG